MDETVAADAATTIELLQEERLVAEARLGNLDALRPLLERYAAPLYNTVILPRLGDAISAEEILRDTLATAVEKIGQFTWQGKSIYPWLRQIAINKIFDLHRHTKRSRRLLEALAFEHDPRLELEEAPDALIIADQERRHHRERIAATLTQIPARYRSAIELRLIAEHSREECARRLEVTVATFDVLFFRAVRAFRKAFGAPPSAVFAPDPLPAPTSAKGQKE